MKWILIFLSLSVSDDVCKGPAPIVKHADEFYDTQQECEDAFHNSKYYKSTVQQQLVGFCLGPIKPMFLSPQQLTNRDTYPKCY
jgi:hypothetical protein